MPTLPATLPLRRAQELGWLVRAGFVSRGLTYGIIGVLAAALAAGAGESSATDQRGALSMIANAPLGGVALIAVAIGLLAYALWKLVQAAFGYGPEGGGGPHWRDRLANGVAGVAYVCFCAVTVGVLVGRSGTGSGQQRQVAAGVLSWPGGPLLVALAGVVLIVVCAVQIYEAVTCKFLDDNKLGQMRAATRRWFSWLGRIGLVSRAAVFALVGYFLIRTAVEYDPSKAIGLDGALRALHRTPYGGWLLAGVAAGLIVFAAFSFLEARYRRL